MVITAHALFCLSNEKKHCERNSWVFPGFTRCKSELVWGINGTEVGHFVWTLHRSTARRRLQELVASSFAEFYRQQHCLYVSTVPSTSRRKDNSALLELCHWRSGVWIVQVPWNCKTAHFRQPPYRVWSAFFHDRAAFTSRSCKSLSFLVTSLKSSSKIRKSCTFPPKKKKTVNKLTVSWRQRAL